MKKNKIHWRKFALLICIFISYLSPPAFAQPADGDDCIILNPYNANPDTSSVNNFIFTYYDGSIQYQMPTVYAAADQPGCLTFCLHNCDIVGTSGGTIDGNVISFLADYDFTISGPSGYTFDESAWPTGTTDFCFTLPSVTGIYTINIYYAGTTTLFMTTAINVLPSQSPPNPLVVSLNPDHVCSCEEVRTQFPGAIQDYQDYYAVHWIFNGANEYKNDGCGGGPGIQIFTATALDACGNSYETGGIFTVDEPNVTFETVQLNCYDVDVRPLYRCLDSTLVGGFFWDFGDGTTSTAADPGPHHYASAGTYHISMTCSMGSNTYYYETDVVISTAALATVSGPTVSCGSPLTYIISGASSVTSYSISPATAGSIAYAGTPNHYTVTVTNYSIPFTITFNYKDPKGCDGIVTYNVKACCPDANVPLTISGPDYTCSTTGLYGVTAASGGTVTYNWTISPAGAGTVTAGAGTPNVTISWANQFTPATITVTSTNENGCTQSGTFSVNACCLSLQSIPAGTFGTDPAAPSDLTAYFGVWPGVPVGTTTLVGKSIYVFNDLTINTNFTFNNCIIYVAPGKSIKVNAGITVNWLNGQVREMCNEMWEGIFAYNTSTHIIGNGTTFRSAVHAMNSYNGGDIDLTGCIFMNDYTGLSIKNYSIGVHPVTVTKCNFYTSTVLIPPYAGRQTHKGIDVESVSDLTIGSTTTANTNTFLKCDFGIHIMNGTVNTFNASYTKIQPTSLSVPSYCCGCDLGTAICDVNTKKDVVYNLTAGQSAVLLNTYNQCNNGVFSVGRVNEKIQYNTMNNVITGVNIYGNNASIDVSPSNQINNYTVGVFMWDVGSANINVKSNLFNTASTGSGVAPGVTFPASFGVHINNPVSVFYTANIDSNTFSHTNNGIFLLNAIGMSGFTTPIQITVHHNVVNYTQYAAMPASWSMENSGIRVENSTAILVQFNNLGRGLTSYSSANAASVGFFRGIKITNSTIVGVIKNLVYDFGEGVRTYGNCNNTMYLCNEFSKNYYAFNHEGPSGTAAINIYQATSGLLPQGNYYGTHSLSGIDLKGGLFPAVHWYYNGSSGYNATTAMSNNSTFSGPPFNNDDQFTAHLNSETCGGIVPFPTEDREQMIGGMEGTTTYSSYNEEYTQFDRLHAFRALKAKPEWLTEGTGDDAVYQDFYDNSLTNGTSDFDSVATSIGKDSLNAARMVNSTISVTNTSDYNLKRVNELYLNSLDSGFTASDSLELYDIAFQNGTLGGPGVYHARAILRLYLDDLNGGEVRSMSITDDGQTTSNAVTGFAVYPNPNTGTFYVTLDNTNLEQAYTVEITDMQGKIVFGESFVYKGEGRMFNLSVENGAYMLILKDKNQQIVKHERIIVSK